jgi:hypothetical protein
MKRLPRNQHGVNDGGQEPPFLVVGGDGELYVSLNASGISATAACWQGVPLVLFGTSKHEPVYLLLADAVAFHEDAQEWSKRRGRPYASRCLLCLMRRRLAVHEAGRDVPAGGE